MLKRLSIMAVVMLFLAPMAVYAQSSDDLLNQALRDYDAHDYEKAKKEFEQLLAREPGNLTAHYHLGILLTPTDPKQAIVHLLYVAKAPIHAPGIKAALAQAYQAAGMNEKALPLWHELHAQHPENHGYVFQYAIALQKEGKNREASRLYEELIKSGDANYEDISRYQLGVLLYGLGSYNLAAKQFRSVPKDSSYAKPARQYLDALAPVIRPFNIYVSGDYFYNDNPGASTSVHLGTTVPAAPAAPSQGTAWVARIGTRQFEFTPQWRAGISYLFYGSFYLKAAASQYDYVAQYLNPEVSFHPNARTSLEIMANLEHYNYSHQWLNTNAGVTASAVWKYSPAHAYRMHASYINKQYTSNFHGYSLQYLNADAYSLGFGTTAASTTWKTKLSIDYIYTLNATNMNNDPVVGLESQDSRYREMALPLKAELPVPGTSDRLRLLADYKYTYRDYTNIQSGALYPDVAGQYINQKITNWSIRLQALLSNKYHLMLSAGYEDNLSKSKAATLTYRYRRYFGRLSAYY